MGKMRKNNRKFTDDWRRPIGPRKKYGERLDPNTLPDTITCALCGRDLPRARYNTSALRRLVSDVRRGGMDVLKNQQVARCDGCGTQSRPELHCMSCNEVRPITEFAHTQRQYDQPVCLPCQDNLQLNERDKAPAGQIPQDEPQDEARAWEDVSEDDVESFETAPEASEATESEMSKESSPAEEETPKATIPSVQKPVEEVTIGDMSFDDLFEDDEDDENSDSW